MITWIKNYFDERAKRKAAIRDAEEMARLRLIMDAIEGRTLVPPKPKESQQKKYVLERREAFRQASAAYERNQLIERLTMWVNKYDFVQFGACCVNADNELELRVMFTTPDSKPHTFAVDEDRASNYGPWSNEMFTLLHDTWESLDEETTEEEAVDGAMDRSDETETAVVESEMEASEQSDTGEVEGVSSAPVADGCERIQLATTPEDVSRAQKSGQPFRLSDELIEYLDGGTVREDSPTEVKELDLAYRQLLGCDTCKDAAACPVAEDK